jgi:hypothetical protein
MGAVSMPSLTRACRARPAPQRVAWQLLGAYAACADLSFEAMQAALTAGLAQLTGAFAFVLVDRLRHRVVAARDRAGAQTLLWGCVAAWLARTLHARCTRVSAALTAVSDPSLLLLLALLRTHDICYVTHAC